MDPVLYVFWSVTNMFTIATCSVIHLRYFLIRKGHIGDIEFVLGMIKTEVFPTNVSHAKYMGV